MTTMVVITPTRKTREEPNEKREADPPTRGGDSDGAGGNARGIGASTALRGLLLALITVASSVGTAGEAEPLRQAVMDCGRSFARTARPASIISSSARGKPGGASSARGL